MRMSALMSPAETARGIAERHLQDASEGDREALTEAIRWAIIQGQIAARQPPEVELTRAPAIVNQIVWFVDHWLVRMRGANYAEQANALQECRSKVLVLCGIVPAQNKPVVKAKELARGKG